MYNGYKFLVKLVCFVFIDLTTFSSELFGALPPKELKAAQRKAKETLENYVKAANKVQEILRIMESSP